MAPASPQAGAAGWVPLPDAQTWHPARPGPLPGTTSAQHLSSRHADLGTQETCSRGRCLAHKPLVQVPRVLQDLSQNPRPAE